MKHNRQVPLSFRELPTDEMNERALGGLPSLARAGAQWLMLLSVLCYGLSALPRGRSVAGRIVLVVLAVTCLMAGLTVPS